MHGQQNVKINKTILYDVYFKKKDNNARVAALFWVL